MKKEKYKVTLVLPIYNVEKYIERSLLSALNQTFSSIEYLIINDHGTDNSMEIARTIINSHPRKDQINIIDHNENRGLGATRNTGIVNAKGEYIYFMDSDDIINPDSILILYNKTLEKKTDLVIGSYKSTDYGSTGKRWEWIFENCYISGHNFEVADYYFKGGFYVMSWNKLYCTEFLRSNNIKCIDNTLHEDIFFAFQVALNAESVITISDVTYYYTFRYDSTMSSYKLKNYLDFYNSIEKMKCYSENFKESKIYPRVVNYIYGFKNKIIIDLNKNQNLTKEIKNEYLKKFSNAFLTINEIYNLKNTKILHKMKFLLSFFPYKIQLFIIQIIVNIYKKL